LHSEIFDIPTPWAQHLERSYLQMDDPCQNELVGGKQWWLNNTDRELILSEHDDTLVVRWVFVAWSLSKA
jgi:hypothetical protein